MAIVINLFSGPGVGKSTTAARVFAELKMKDINCEMALEFAKDKVWEDSFKTLENQIYVFGKQFHRIWRLKDKVDVIICDSPLLNSIIYDSEKENELFHKFIIEQFNKFDNLNFFIERTVEYRKDGRYQTKEEAIKLDETIRNVLIDNEIYYTSVNVDDAVKKIVDATLNKMEKK